jgi:uncharacterized protein
MSERDTYPAGVPSWVDTVQPDPQAAMSFYGRVFGWEFAGPGTGDYYEALLRGRPVAGVGALPPGAQAAWTTYVTVDSADEAAAKARELGGAVLTEPFDVPPAGRLAVLADPTGATFGVWQAGARHGAELVNEPGAWAMSTLGTPDADRAAAFYGELFGWEFQQQAPVYSTITNEGRANGGIRLEKDLPPHWLPYFTTESVTESAVTAREAGGQVLGEPVQVPAGTFIFLLDPQGAPFGVVEGEVDD